MNRSLLVAAVAAGATALAAGGVELGAWWLTFGAGLGVGALLARARVALPVAAIAGGLGWGVPLAWVASRYGAGPTAGVLAGILGAAPLGPPAPVALTCAIGVLLAVAGAWLATALRGAFRRAS